MVEVCVATIIAATTTMGVFSVILSSFASQKRADKKEISGLILKQAQETLKSYVSADPNNINYSPNAGGHWPADLYGGWALATGNHNITSLLTGTPLADVAPYSLTYTVTNNNCLNIGAGVFAGLPNTDSNQCKIVTFHLTFQDQ